MAFNRKNKVASYEDRIAQANDATGTAIFVFEQAAITLEQSATAGYAVSDDIGLEIARLEEIQNNAWDDALTADSAAIKIRNLLF